MPWRNWSVIIVLVLANYVVFSIIGTLLFPATPPAPPTRMVQPTFTLGAPPMQRVGPLSYEILTPSPTATSTPAPTSTAAPRFTATPAATP